MNIVVPMLNQIQEQVRVQCSLNTELQKQTLEKHLDDDFGLPELEAKVLAKRLGEMIKVGFSREEALKIIIKGNY